ncbi:3-oxoacyl-ACP reductase family protein [Hoyosella subflava]|uniref:Oxidoreductase, short chain dehydrogenase/reductase family n=1 Tax=Hoyosella subflava (strain DSM 45089 / JCM 17490 / NBRC 109087 / DQS3-9A1) TaxID=443218 RepID=F6EFM5_HOYSD|nr:3-oxoacyl-ACP reductase family protein [Hoyosella subflava]AEF40954.1 Oxidoreductase, short chain dehydrogenase/reductase family [Hoyosella subflava DQS3-9A1]
MSRLTVVTGAGRGLGYAIAERLAAAGDHVVIAERNSENAVLAEKRLRAKGYQVTSVLTDISDRESVRELASITEELGGVDALVNNAALADGVGGDAFWELDEDFFERVLRVNTFGTWLVSKHLYPQLAARARGAIVNVASDAALYGSPRLVHYTASKGAVISMTRTMARDAGPHNVRVNAVAPGLIRVEATESVPADRFQLYSDNHVLPREQTPEDVAGAVEYLLSESAGFITGQTLVVDGGFVMGN